MIQKTLFVLIMMALSSITFAQSNTEDVLYLKNGSIIRGKIVDQMSPDKVRVELMGGSVFVFAKAEIDSMKRENVIKRKQKEIQTNYYRKDRGFRNMTELAIIYGVNFKNNPNGNYDNGPDDIGLSLQTINGYQVWPYLFVGGGIGIDRFITYQQTFSPFFLRLSSEFLKRKVTPYIYTDAGYSVMWNQPNQGGEIIQNTGGAYFGAGGGVRIYTRSLASVILSAGYKMNMSNTNYSNEGGYYADAYSISRTYQRFVMNIGVSF